MEAPKLEFLHNALEGLREIRISDGDRYRQAVEQSPQRAWTNYFPFLVGLSASSSRSILLGEEAGSLCLYLLYHRRDRNRLHLYVPPLPMTPAALASSFERLRAYNGNTDGRLLWINEALKGEIERLGMCKLRRVDEEVIYAPAALQDLTGSQYRVLRYQLRRAQREQAIEARPLVASDKATCLALLDQWHRSRLEQGIEETSYSYTKACLAQFEQFDRQDLQCYVYSLAGQVRAFAMGGRLAGDVACSFVNISDHTHASLGYFSRYHFIKSMADYATVNDAGCMGLEALMHVKNQLVPLGLQAIYRAKPNVQRRVVSAAKPLRLASNAAIANANENGSKQLKSLSLVDEPLFDAALERAGSAAWLAHFPYLYCYSMRKRRSLYWELYRGSVCLYAVSEGKAGRRMSLFIPPFPYTSGALQYAVHRVQTFNQESKTRILWLEPPQRSVIERLGYTVRSMSGQNIYSKESLDSLLNTHPLMNGLATRRYVKQDTDACLVLLERWRDGYRHKGGRLANYSMLQSCVRHALDSMRARVCGEVLLVDGQMQGFSFATATGADHASLFATLVAPEHNALQLYLQACLSQRFSAPYYTIPADADTQASDSRQQRLQPLATQVLYRATLVTNN